MADKKYRILICLLLCFAFLLPTGVSAKTKAPVLEGKGAILIDASTGQILYEKNIHKKFFPASTTKMLTAILAIENLDLGTEVVIDKTAPLEKGNSMNLVEGEKITVENLLYGMMVSSANDAAVALAIAVSGSVEDFTRLMNQKAKELGAINSNFVNPNGLHDDMHCSTAFDLAVIARYCMKNDTFRKFVKTVEYKVPATNKQKERVLESTNRMLYDEKSMINVNGKKRACFYAGTTGIKTGYTSKAGGCLAASVKKEDGELICITLSSTDLGRFADCIGLFEYGYDNYNFVKLHKKNGVADSVKVRRGKAKKVDLITKTDVVVLLPADESKDVCDLRVDLKDKKIVAPVKKGDKLGDLKVIMGDEVIGSYPLFAKEAVEEGLFAKIFISKDNIFKTIVNILIGFVAILIGLLVIYIIFKRRQIRRKKRRRRAAYIKKRQKEREREDDMFRYMR